MGNGINAGREKLRKRMKYLKFKFNSLLFKFDYKATNIYRYFYLIHSQASLDKRIGRRL